MGRGRFVPYHLRRKGQTPILLIGEKQDLRGTSAGGDPLVSLWKPKPKNFLTTVGIHDEILSLSEPECEIGAHLRHPRNDIPRPDVCQSGSIDDLLPEARTPASRLTAKNISQSMLKLRCHKRWSYLDGAPGGCLRWHVSFELASSYKLKRTY